MIDLTTILPKLLHTSGANAELAVKLAWTRAAGKGLRRHAVAIQLKEKTLFVAVGDQIWQRQLGHMAPELIFRMNNLLQKSLIDSIEFRVDPPLLREAQAQPQSREVTTELSPLALSELQFAASSIADEELRDRFVRAAQNCIARRDTREKA